MKTLLISLTILVSMLCSAIIGHVALSIAPEHVGGWSVLGGIVMGLISIKIIARILKNKAM
jgi:putative Mn2+ efflux pump MntP